MIETDMRIFLEACGLLSGLTLECDDPGLPATGSICHTHRLPFTIVGRDSRSDLRLNDPLISRRHAYLQVIAGRLFCIDLDSRSRIRWEGDGTPTTTGWLEQEQFLWLGHCRLCWRGQLGAEAQDAEMLDPFSPYLIDRSEANPLPLAELELPIRIGETSSNWTISSRLSLIGRTAECQLALADDSVSRYHASLIRTPRGMWVVDLLSREGVWVNGTRVRWAWLDDGDTLRIGRFTFVLRYRFLPDQIARGDVPLDAGAIFSPSSARARNSSGGLPAKLARSLASRSHQGSPQRTQLEPSAPVVVPLSLAPGSGDLWSGDPDFGPGPSMLWNQHIQFLEMLHSEMILMVKMFMTMHREQVGSIRDELDRVQQLTRELEILQSKLGEPSSAEKLGPNAGTERMRREARTQLPVKAWEEQRPRGSTMDSRRVLREQRRSPDPTADSGVEEASASSTTAADRRVAGKLPQVDTVEFHAEITKRIAELQRERQGYWRRILSAMSVSLD
jgi:pSer/pThr/pTyr-binding forkhead associated (FHA) protein